MIMTTETSKASIRQVVKQFKESLSHANPEESGMDFWSSQSSTMYPLLKPLALDLLAMPASKAFAERDFSLTGDLKWPPQQIKCYIRKKCWKSGEITAILPWLKFFFFTFTLNNPQWFGFCFLLQILPLNLINSFLKWKFQQL